MARRASHKTSQGPAPAGASARALSNRIVRLEAAVVAHMPESLAEFRQELETARESSASGDLQPMLDAPADWEATVEEVLAGPLEVDLKELRSRPRTGVRVEEALRQLFPHRSPASNGPA